MSKQNRQKPEAWRIIVGILSLAFILYLWPEKDIAAIYAGMPGDLAIPLIVTTVAVSLFKVLLIAGAVLLIKWLMGKFSAK